MDWVTLPARTKNIGSGGVLLISEKEPHVGEVIEYLITLGNSAEGSAGLRCRGTVLRLRQVYSAGQPVFEMAVTMGRRQFVSPEAAPSLKRRR